MYFREHEHVSQVLACCYDSFVGFEAFRAFYDVVQLCYIEGAIAFERWRRGNGRRSDVPELWAAGVPHIQRLVGELHRDIGKTRQPAEIQRITREIAPLHDENGILQSPRYSRKRGPHFVTSYAHKRWHERKNDEGVPQPPASMSLRMRSAAAGATFYLGQLFAGLADDLTGTRRPRNASSLRMALRHARNAFLPLPGKSARASRTHMLLGPSPTDASAASDCLERSARPSVQRPSR
jgi:hypothetical protein